MTLSKILDGVVVSKMFQSLYGQMVVTHDAEIRHLQYDSRKVESGDIFVAIRGTGIDGHRFIDQAVARGSRAVVLEDDGILPDSFFMHTGVIKIVVPDSRRALAQMAANVFHHPSRQLTVVGVTGTNGKTTTSHLIQAMLETNGMKSGLIGTIEYRIGSEVIAPATHTTPESLELQELLATMVASHCRGAVMEVSSHALAQHRTEGIDFAAAVFTNLTQDHLDYHNTMEDYFQAKSLLFRGLSSSSWAIVNADDERSARLKEMTKARTLTFGTAAGSDFTATGISLSMQGTEFTVMHDGESTRISSPLIGRFNVSNMLAAFSTGVSLGISKSAITEALHAVRPVRGRFEQFHSSRHGWTAVIDYAHTPDALEKALQTLRDIRETNGRIGRIITVFGCGGNRDTTKRPLMGKIAAEFSDAVIVTSDNPRNEDPESIIDNIFKGIPPSTNVVRNADRRSAIAQALQSSRESDVVLIAGKGHEEYQIVGDRKLAFSDRTVVEEFLDA